MIPLIIIDFVYITTPSADQGQSWLAYINFEEGRIRVIQPVSESNGYDGLVIAGNISLPGGMSGVWDYFIRDYQENVRSIVTEEIHEGTNECTMEMSRKPEEDPVFQGSDDELDNTRVPITVIPGQTTGGGWHSNTSGYVCQLAKLSGEQMTGPNVLLKVMAGDTINAAVQYYYPSPVTNTTGSTGLVQDVLASLMNALTSGTCYCAWQ